MLKYTENLIKTFKIVMKIIHMVLVRMGPLILFVFDRIFAIMSHIIYWTIFDPNESVYEQAPA